MKNIKQIEWVKVKCSQCGKMFECRNATPCHFRTDTVVNYKHERLCYCKECTEGFSDGKTYGCEYREVKVKVIFI